MKLHQLKGYIQNIYFAEYPDKLLMLDGGSRPDVSLIEDFFSNELKRPISDLKLIVVTHMHPDHGGAAPLLRKKYNIPIAAHATADGWHKGVKGYLTNKVATLLSHFVAKKTHRPFRKMRFARFLKANVHLNEQDQLPGFPDWTVISTPGHTDHDISLWHAQSQTIYIGDLFIQVKRNCQLPFPITYPELIKESIRKIANINPSKILSAHGIRCDDINNEERFLQLQKQANQKLRGKYKFLHKLIMLTK
ncbi:MAG: MBL fold metallo-hydrolase [Bacteroidota bacterium]|nr:MBL fold metallo-hydrolase [Bacteroidota bacterium]